MAANDVGDIKESAMHQPLLSPDGPLVVVALQILKVFLVNTEQPYTFGNGTVTSPYYPNNIINPVIVPLYEQHRLSPPSQTTILKLIEVTSLLNGCWRLV
ncbi:hypothetical protein XENOCAPTIV_020975 [Xenoophorus captivus]|uniref:Uncharacterized protein n=1 Tax=Xenoophorus captivus TaxID=1517983 RepID=A0ABV0Q3V5_9TELE